MAVRHKVAVGTVDSAGMDSAAGTAGFGSYFAGSDFGSCSGFGSYSGSGCSGSCRASAGSAPVLADFARNLSS